MNSVKRILISLKTQMSHVVDDFENHEALATVAIDEIEKIGRNSRIQLNRVRNRITELEKKFEEQQADVEKWSERAVKLESSDRESALNCVKRLKDAEKQIEILGRQRQQAIAQEKKISADLARISEQVGELKTRRESLIARQNVVQTTAKAGRDYGNPVGNASSLFDRWENQVLGSEFELPADDPTDAFEEHFEKQEYEVDLKETLAKLVEKNRNS